jgi:hypothetical protein
VIEPSWGPPADPAARPGGPHRHLPHTAVGTGALLAGALGYVALVDPHHSSSVYPPCPFKWLTGWNCPLCGGLRMTHDLLHGDLPAAVNDNVFLLVGAPLVALWVVLRRRRGKSALPVSAMLGIAVAAALWTLARNLPGFPLLPTVTG